MVKLLGIALAASVVVATGFSSAQAEGIYAEEFRFGGTWAQPEFLDGNHAEKEQWGINGELLFSNFDFDFRATPTEGVIRQLLTPRLHIGGTANFDTNGTSLAYAGLTWKHPLTKDLFLEWSFGGSINDGKKANVPGRASLGSNVLFRESIALGYQFSERMNVILQVDHSSNADLADRNRGLTAMHLKIGYSF